MSDDSAAGASPYRPPPVFSARQRILLPYVVLVLVAVAAAIVLTVHFAGGGKQAKAGRLIFATDAIPVAKHWPVLLPGVRLDAAVTIRTSVPDDLAARRYDAPDGGRFVGLRVTESAADPAYVPNFGGTAGTDQTIRLRLIADGHSYPLRADDYGSDDETDVPLAVYVPVSGDPSSLRLEVTRQGRSQSIDLRTGKRQAGDYAPLYSQPTTRLASCGTPRITAGYTAQYTAPTCRYEAVRVPYVYGNGWAPKGKVWLDIRVATEQPKGLLAHRAGAAPAAYYVDTFPDSTPMHRLDGVKPIRSGSFLGYDPSGTSAELLFSVPPNHAAAHTLTVVQKTQGYARIETTGVPFDTHVTETWTVRIP